MQRRSWMAALTLVALGCSSSRAEEPAPAAPTPAPKADPKSPAAASVRRKVALNLHFNGLSYRSVVTIKPGSPACRFEPVTIPITNIVKPTQVKPIDVEVFSADRDCSLVITLVEDGQAPKTMRRTFRVEPDDPAKPAPQAYHCYLSGLITKANAAPAAVATKDAKDTKPAATRK